MFKCELAKNVLVGVEKGVCDVGYRGCDEKLFLPFWRIGMKKLKEQGKPLPPRNDLHERIRGRHEQTNGRLHQWNCISSIFRHDIKEHQDFFHASAVVVQLEIMNGFAEQFNVAPDPFVEPETYETTPDAEEQY
jgi:hypothetical protein